MAKVSSLKGMFDIFIGQAMKSLPEIFSNEDWETLAKVEKSTEYMREALSEFRKQRDSIYDTYANMHGENFNPAVKRLRKKNSGRPASVKVEKYSDLDF